MIESPSRRPRIWSPKRWISFFDPPPALLRLLAVPLVQTRLSFFPRYYLVSTALCHGSTKFEAFIECLRTRRSTPTHDVYKRPSLSLARSVLIFFQLFRSLDRSSSLASFLGFPRQLSSFRATSQRKRRVCIVQPRGRNFQRVSLGYSGPRSRPRFSLQRYTSVYRSSMHVLFQMLRRDIRRKRERARPRSRGSNCQPGYAGYVYSSNFLFVAFRARTC